MSHPTISVVIPTYNRSHLIGRAIRSILAQTYSDFEIIVVDDCSTDNTQDVIKSFDDSRIKYILHAQNCGVNIVRNTGIDAAQGEYVAFLDSDDEWLPEKLEKQFQAFANHDSQVGACYTWTKTIHEITLQERVVAPTYEGFIFEDLLYSCFTTTSSMVIKRECLQAVGGFDTSSLFRSCQDWDLWLRLAQRYKFIVVPEALLIFWNHDSQNRNTNNYQRMLDGYVALLEKHPEMRDLPKTFRQIGSDSLEKKGNYFFERGKRYMYQAGQISHAEGIKLAKLYLRTAFLANPKRPRFFAHYFISSLFEPHYLPFDRVDNRLRKLARKILARI